MPRLRSSIGFLAVGAILLVAGCSGSTPGSSGGGGGGAQGTGPITFAIGKDTSGFFPARLAEWNNQHPDQKATLLELPEQADQQRQQFATTLQAKSDRYDVLGLDVVWTAEFAKEGWIQQLDKAAFPQDQYLPGAYESATFEGNLWAAPLRTNGGLLFYRKDILDKEGLQPPTSWEQVEQYSKDLGPKYNIGGFAGLQSKYEGLTVQFSELTWAAGGNLMDPGGNVAVDSPQARKAAQFLQDGLKQGWIPKEAVTYSEEPLRRSFEQGKLLFMREWPYAYNLAKKNPKIADKFGVEPLPGFTDGKPATAVGGYNLAVSSYSTKKGTATEFIKFLTNAENQKQQLIQSSEAPTLKALYDDPELLKQVPYLPALKQTLLNSRSRPVTPFYNDVSLAIQNAAYAAEQDQKSPDQAVKDMAGAMQSAIKQ